MRLCSALIRKYVNVLVIDTTSESLDEGVISSAAFVVHADLDGVVGRYFGEVATGEQTAMISTEYIQCSGPGNRLIERLDAEIRSYAV